MSIINENSQDRNDQAEESPSPNNKKQTLTQQVVELALNLYTFNVDADGKPFGVRKGGHLAQPLVGGRRSIRQELAGQLYRRTGNIASAKALTEAVEVLGFVAEEQGNPVQLFMRVARPNDGEILVDMGDKTERALRITGDGWEILDGDAEVPVLFRRTSVTGPLPTPEPGGDLNQLWRFINVRDPADQELLIGWLVAAYILVGTPCPMLALMGEQGTAKTSSLKRAFSLFDPTAAPVRRPPSDPDRVLHAAAHARSLGLDNASVIPRWLSDALCRLVTGEGDVDRALYTDSDPRIMQLQVILAFTAIDVGVLNGDLAERTVWGNLVQIPDSERRSERELNAAWEESYASILGGLLDLTVLVLQKLPDVQLDQRPRMADFAEVLDAMDRATGTDALNHYMTAQASVASEIVDTDKFLSSLTQSVTGRWYGTGKELHELLPAAGDPKFWPTARGMAGKLRRVAPDLRKAGWHVEEIAPDPTTKRAKTWVIAPPEAHTTEADLAGLQLAFENYDSDLDHWTQRVCDAGASAECADYHAESARLGMGSGHCSAKGCRFPGPRANPQWAIQVERSKAIDEWLVTVTQRTGLDRRQMNERIAQHSANAPDETETMFQNRGGDS